MKPPSGPGADDLARTTAATRTDQADDIAAMTEAPRSEGADDIAVMTAALAATAMRLHGIASRTEGAKIAAEVLRLNDAVRAGSSGRLRSGDHPQDFAALLLSAADPVNQGA